MFASEQRSRPGRVHPRHHRTDSAPTVLDSRGIVGLSSDDTRRREVVRDLAAGALLIGALFFPWNLYFGFRIPDSSKTVFGLLLAVTSLSLASLAVTFAGRRSQLRLGLNVPYLLLVLAFVVFDAIQTIRLGGTVHVPGGVGPGMAGDHRRAVERATGANRRYHR